MTAYAFLLPGSYILQMRIDLNHCHHLIDESGQMDRDYTWNINVLPSVIEPLSAFIIIPDNAKAKYMQVEIFIACCDTQHSRELKNLIAVAWHMVKSRLEDVLSLERLVKQLLSIFFKGSEEEVSLRGGCTRSRQDGLGLYKEAHWR